MCIRGPLPFLVDRRPATAFAVPGERFFVSDAAEATNDMQRFRSDGSATIFVSHAAKQHGPYPKGNGWDGRISLQHGKDSGRQACLPRTYPCLLYTSPSPRDS